MHGQSKVGAGTQRVTNKKIDRTFDVEKAKAGRDRCYKTPSCCSGRSFPGHFYLLFADFAGLYFFSGWTTTFSILKIFHSILLRCDRISQQSSLSVSR